MYTKPLIGNGRRESEFWFRIKELWLKVKYDDKYDKITKKNFFENFPQYCEKYGIKWDCKDKKGNPKIPNVKDYDHARKNSCFKKYAWDECFQQYESDQMTNAEKNAIKAYKKSVYLRTLKKLDQLDELDAHEDKLLQEQKEGASNEKRIEKTEKTIRAKEIGLREDLGLNKTTFEFDGNVDVKSDVTVNLLEKVKQKRNELNELRSNNE